MIFCHNTLYRKHSAKGEEDKRGGKGSAEAGDGGAEVTKGTVPAYHAHGRVRET
jgi:hypothetical protein